MELHQRASASPADWWWVWNSVLVRHLEGWESCWRTSVRADGAQFFPKKSLLVARPSQSIIHISCWDGLEFCVVTLAAACSASFYHRHAARVSRRRNQEIPTHPFPNLINAFAAEKCGNLAIMNGFIAESGSEKGREMEFLYGRNSCSRIGFLRWWFSGFSWKSPGMTCCFQTCSHRHRIKTVLVIWKNRDLRCMRFASRDREGTLS